MIQHTRHLPARLHRQRRRARRFDHGEPISRIDTRPMVFVAMFLAIMFLFPAMQMRPHALLIDLPQWGPPPHDWIAPPYLTVEVSSDGQILLEGVVISLDRLAQAIRDKRMTSPVVAFHPSGDTSYGIAALALNEISKAGVRRNSICFIGNEAYRQFDRIGYYEVTTFVGDRQQEWRRTDTNYFEPDPCTQFYIQYELY